MSIRNKKHRLILDKVEKFMKYGMSKKKIAEELKMRIGQNCFDKNSVKYYVFCVDLRKAAKKNPFSFSNKELKLLTRIGENLDKKQIMTKIKKINPNRKSWDGIRKILNEKLNIKRNHMTYESICKKFKKPLPSREFAWFLGVLAGDAFTSGYAISLKAKDKVFVDKFANITNKLFGLKVYRSMEKGRYYLSRLFSIRLVKFLDNWKKDKGQWVKTINQKYSWIFKKNKYLIGFLTGFFDSEGCVLCRRRNKNRKLDVNIYLSSLPRNSRMLLSAMLKQLSINSRICPKYVRIGGVKECKKFADQVKSVIPRREEFLKIIRKIKVVNNSNRIQCYRKSQKLKDSGLMVKDIIKKVEDYGIHKKTIEGWLIHDRRPKPIIEVPRGI